MKIRLRVTAFLILMSLGWLSATFGLVAFWLSYDVVRSYAVIPLVAIGVFFLAIFVSITVVEFRKEEDRAALATLLVVLGYALGFVIPLWLTGFAAGTFQMKPWNFAVLIGLAIAGFILVAKEWTQKDPRKQASLFPRQGD